MLPLPEDVIADICTSLRDVLIPALEDGFAREQAGLMLSLLEHVRLRLEREAALLIEDTEDIERVLADLAVELPMVASAAPIPADALAQLRDRNRQCSAALQEALRAEEAGWSGEGPVPEQLAQLRAVVGRQLGRQRTMVGPGYALGT